MRGTVDRVHTLYLQRVPFYCMHTLHPASTYYFIKVYDETREKERERAGARSARARHRPAGRARRAPGVARSTVVQFDVYGLR